MTTRTLNVIVVGGSSGIGAAVVTAFARASHNVLFTYYANGPSLDSRKHVAHTYLDQGDVRSIVQFEAYARRWLADSAGVRAKLDVLVNNAALGSATVQNYVRSKSMLLDGCEDVQVAEDWALMGVNALGPLWITQRMLSLLRSVDGSRSTGSVGGSHRAFPEYRPSDLMSKAAVTYLSQHLAAAHTHTNIDIICVSPGATETTMFRSSTLEKLAHPDAFLQQMPKGRLIQPTEVANLIYTLCVEPWGRILHGATVDASLGLGVRPGLQTEMNAYQRSMKQEQPVDQTDSSIDNNNNHSLSTDSLRHVFQHQRTMLMKSKI